MITVLCTVLQCSVGWIGTHGDPNLQIAQELLCGGALELAVLIAASIVLVRFPAFLRDVVSEWALARAAMRCGADSAESFGRWPGRQV